MMLPCSDKSPLSSSSSHLHSPHHCFFCQMLTKSDNHLLKGIAILSIMLHNLLHLLPRAVAENEFEFSARNIHRVVYEFHHSHDVWSIISALISHFGHYGVSIFLFLSGYGLVMKYEKSSSSIPLIPSFIWQHMKKLWGLMVPGFVVAFFFLIDWNTFTLQLKDSNPWLTFAFLGNFFKFDTLLYGPWWFFSLMLQFYILYRLVLYRWKSPILLWSLVLVSIIIMWWSNESHIRVSISHSSLLRYIRVSAFGHLLPFALGISSAGWSGGVLMTRWQKQCSPLLQKTIGVGTSILGFLLLFCSAFQFLPWLFSPVFVIIAIVPLTVIFQRPVWRLGWEHIGFYSSALFVYHPIIREEVLPRAAQAAAQNDVVALMESVILFITFAYILARIDLALRTWWKQSRQSPPS